MVIGCCGQRRFREIVVESDDSEDFDLFDCHAGEHHRDQEPVIRAWERITRRYVRLGRRQSLWANLGQLLELIKAQGKIRRWQASPRAMLAIPQEQGRTSTTTDYSGLWRGLP